MSVAALHSTQDEHIYLVITITPIHIYRCMYIYNPGRGTHGRQSNMHSCFSWCDDDDDSDDNDDDAADADDDDDDDGAGC